MRNSRVKRAVEAGAHYLLSQGRSGRYREFDGLAYGASGPWITACVGSSLLDVGVRDERLLQHLIRSQRRNGGWAYNWKVPADADSTLRVLQYLALVGCRDETTITRGERFVLTHQTADGGIATYQRTMFIRFVAKTLGYSNVDGWTTAHGCVSALALNVLRSPPPSLRAYVEQYVATNGCNSYWWRTQLYIGNELDRAGIVVPVESSGEHDPIAIALALIMDARHGIHEPASVEMLVASQDPSGKFPGSSEFRIPRPNQRLGNVVPTEEPGVRIAVEERSLLSTCAATVALHRQLQLTA